MVRPHESLYCSSSRRPFGTFLSLFFAIHNVFLLLFSSIESRMCVVCGRHDRCRCGRRSDDGQAGKLKSNAWKMINGRDSLKILSSLFQFLALTLPLPPTHTRTRNIFICVSLQCNHVVVVADRPLMKYK